MALIEVNGSLQTKIASIDNEHIMLIGMINDFYENIKKKTNKELISGLLKKMRNYAEFHFATEEKYFRQFNYPDYESHKKEHDSFVEKVAELESKFNEGKVILSYEITSFLRDWLVNHIKGTDMKYVEFLVAQGVK